MKHPCVKTYTPDSYRDKGNRRFNASFKNNKQGELMTNMDTPDSHRDDRIKKIIKTHETSMLKLLSPKGMTNSEQHVTIEKQ